MPIFHVGLPASHYIFTRVCAFCMTRTHHFTHCGDVCWSRQWFFSFCLLVYGGPGYAFYLRAGSHIFHTQHFSSSSSILCFAAVSSFVTETSRQWQTGIFALLAALHTDRFLLRTFNLVYLLTWFLLHSLKTWFIPLIYLPLPHPHLLPHAFPHTPPYPSSLFTIALPLPFFTTHFTRVQFCS